MRHPTIGGDDIVVVGKNVPQTKPEQLGRFVDGLRCGNRRIPRRVFRQKLLERRFRLLRRSLRGFAFPAAQ